MEKALISIQHAEGQGYSQPKFHNVPKGAAGEIAQIVADITGKVIRLSYPFNDMALTFENVGRLNGHYFHPKQ